jgi:hypothetical protein
MKNVTFLAAAFVSTAIIATPALAQSSSAPKTGDQIKAGTQMKTPKAKPMHTSHMRTHKRHHARHHARMQEQRPYRQTADSGFWPGQVVGGAIGAAGTIAATAVGTAGAIAAAPFEGPYYSRDVGYRYGDSYAYAGEPGWNSGYYGYGTYSYDGNPLATSPNYDARNGFMCRPGTITRIGNERVICQ